MDFGIRTILENQSRTFKFHQNQTRITVISHKDGYTFSAISRSVLLGMRNVSEESFRKKSKYIFYVWQLFVDNRTVHEITWRNSVHRKRPQMTLDNGACALHAG